MSIDTAPAPNIKPGHFNGSSFIYAEPPKVSLPVDGMSRWNQIQPFSPFSREKFRQLVIAGKAPPAIRLSERCTCYSNRELHKFFADPLHYKISAK